MLLLHEKEHFHPGLVVTPLFRYHISRGFIADC